MTVLQAIILGLVEGVTEFLPVSSSGHLVLMPYVFGWADQGVAFDVMAHMGALAAIVLLLFDRLRTIVKGFFMPKKYPQAARLAWSVIVASIPAFIAGYYLNAYISSTFRSPLYVAAGLLLGSVALFAADWFLQRYPPKTPTLDSFSPVKGLWVGIAQVVSLLPGVSRSGITMSAAVLMGTNRSAAAEFSFLLSIPIFLGAGVYKLSQVALTSSAGVSVLLSPPMIVGFFVSALAAGMSIRFLLRYLSTQKFRPFIVYRVVLAIVILAVVGYTDNL